jgi:predicted acetyltransferase
MEIEVVRASAEEEPIVANLLELYIHDLSEFIELTMQSNGRFEYPWLADYWVDQNRFPFLVKVDGNLAGFVLVHCPQALTQAGQIWDVAEFFIIRGLRRRGIGRAVAHEVWRRHPGAWEVRVRETNVLARPFWVATIASFTGSAPIEQSIQQGEKRWHIFSFVSTGGQGAPFLTEGPV